MIDFTAVTRAAADVVTGIRDDDLDRPTPCTDTTVRDLLVHLDGGCIAFANAAAKVLGAPGTSQAPGPVTETPLEAGRRERIPARLDALAAAWRDPAAWQCMTAAGGVDLPGEVAAFVALDELVVHGWDLATATGRSFVPDDAALAGALGFVGPTATANPDGVPGLFGPRVGRPRTPRAGPAPARATRVR